MANDAETREREHRSEKHADEEEREREREREREKDAHSIGHGHRHGSGPDKGKAKATSSAAAAYGPEFLRAFAKPASILSGRSKHADADDEAPFDVISGADARRFARQFVRDQEAETTAEGEERTDKTDAHAQPKANARTLPPVVFAFPRSAAGDAGRKVVDFYMSWRGKTKTTRLKGTTRRAGFLDAEFRRVRKTLDGEWRRASRALKGSDWAVGQGGGGKLARAPTDPQPLPRLPPLLAEYAREERDGHAPAAPAARSVSDPLPPPSSFPLNGARPPLGVHRGSIDSVTSLPLLGMVRGVPAGNRVPLRVTNPGDRMSMSSSSGSAVVEAPTAKASRGSPLRDGVAFDVPDSEAMTQETYRLQLPGRTASDSSAASSSGSSRKSKSRKEKQTRVEEGGQEKILIVLLDEKDRAEAKGKPDADATWHGLERRLSTRSARKPSPPGSTHDSPWMGPLVHLDEDITYLNTPGDSDSDSDDAYEDDAGSDWGRRGAVVPIKNLLSAMGYLAPEAAVMGGTPSPYGSYTALPTPYNSPYAAAARLSAYSSPYVTPYSPYQSPYQPHVQPPSRPQTPVSYHAGGTPPMGQLAPAWASPGGGYPPTNYTSPAPGAYASPYASPAAGYASPAAGYASPAAGYASPAAGYVSPAAGYASPAAGYAASATGYPSPAAGYASPAAGYTNLGAGYSSPYVPPLQGPGSSFHYS